MVLFAILFFAAAVRSQTQSCEGSSDCICIPQPSSYQVACPKSPYSDSMFTADYQRNNSFQIQCKNSGDIDFNLMKGLNIGPIKFFGLKFCPLPNITFKELMASMQITQASKIDFKSYSDLDDTLNPDLFEGLETVTQLSLNNNGLTKLPDNLFDSMPGLTSISLWNNRLKTLPRFIFSRTPYLQVLELGQNQLINLEPGVFKNLSHIRLLNLWSNQLINLSRAVFADVPNLENLDLASNGLKTLPPDIFADLTKLSALNLNHNEFTHLPYGLFYGTPSLERLRLNFNRKTLKTLPDFFLANLTLLSEVTMTQCNISSIPRNLFWNSKNILHVSFEGNQLKQLPEDLFRDSKELLTVDFSKNKIESLPDFLFESTPKIKDIKLSHNNLHTISRLTFRGLSLLNTLDLEWNRLSNIDGDAFIDLGSLTRIQLSNNKLAFMDKLYEIFGPTSSPLQYCKKLEIILLANNSIETIFQDWQLLTTLRILDLSRNKIKNISKEDLLFVSNDVTVNLNDNEISTVNFRHIEQFALLQLNSSTGVNYKNEKKSINVKIGNNPIICDCFIYDLIRYYEGTLTPEVRFLFSIDLGETRCAGPNGMQHLKVATLNSKILTCSWDQIGNISHPCPQHCACAFRVHDNAMIMDCSNGDLDRFPDSIPSVSGLMKTELNLSNNKLRKLPTDDVFIKHNITKIDVSYNQIGNIDQILFPQSLQVLRLDHNNLSKVSEQTLHRWERLELSQVTLHGNHWKCDCEAAPLLNFIQAHYTKIPNYENVTCWPSNTPIKKLKTSNLCPLDLLIYGCISIAILGVLSGFIAAVYYRYQREIKVWLFAHQLCLWFVTEEELDKDKKYDAFVSYSSLDKAFVEDILVPQLESGPNPFKLCVHYRDWPVGEFITDSIIRSVDNSRRTLIILSKNFIESDWSKLEFQAAHKRALSEGRARVIIVLFGDIGPKDNLDEDVKTYLSTNTYVEWGDPWFWQKLRYALPHPPELRKKVPGELRDKNIRRVTTEKLDLVHKSNGTVNMESTPPANSITMNPFNSLNGVVTNDASLIQCK
nr:PREDICTED: protein toll [Bemisia tabaci]